MSKSRIAGPHGSSVFSCLSSTLVFIVVAPVYIPTKTVQVFPLHPLQHIVYRLFYDSHSDWREVVPHSGFYLHFSDNE